MSLLKVDSAVIHAQLEAMTKLARELDSYVVVLRRELSSLNRMKDGPVIRQLKQEVRRINGRIREVSASIEQLRAAALAGLEILMDCERSIIALAGEMDVGEDAAPQRPVRATAAASPSLRPYVRMPESRMRYQTTIIPGWLRSAATAYFAANP